MRGPVSLLVGALAAISVLAAPLARGETRVESSWHAWIGTVDLQVEITVHGQPGARHVGVRIERGEALCVESAEGTFSEVPGVSAVLDTEACGSTIHVEWSTDRIDARLAPLPAIVPNGDECPGTGDQSLRGGIGVVSDQGASTVVVIDDVDHQASGAWRSATGYWLDQRLGPCPR